jgi:hypothetical protein
MKKGNKYSTYLWLSSITITCLLIISIVGPVLLNKAFTASNLQSELKTLKEIALNDSISKKRIQYQLSIIEDSINSIKPISKRSFEIIRINLNEIDAKGILQIIQKIELKASKWVNNNEIQNLNWFKTIFSWPLLILYIILTLIYFRVSINDFQKSFGKIKSINIFGNGIDFSPDSKISSELAIKEFRSQINDIFSYEIQKEELKDKLRYLYEDIKKYLREEKIIQNEDTSCLRCTIHIQDILFEETLYQLLDYFPKGIGGAGRIKSSRFGIIGLAWRTENSKIRGNISNSALTLIENWGMDKNETISDSSIKSFAAILLKDTHATHLGVIYLDSVKENLFGDSSLSESLLDQAINFENLF